MKTQQGFTLIEIMTVLFILSLLAFMSYRGLGTVLDTRQQIAIETDKWRQISAFLFRFEQDLLLAAPYPGLTTSGHASLWQGNPGDVDEKPRLEFSRFASDSGTTMPRRVAYHLNVQQEIELWLWPGLDNVPGVYPTHYPVLTQVILFELQHLDDKGIWQVIWPAAPHTSTPPLAVRLRIVLVSGEEIIRVFSLI